MKQKYIIVSFHHWTSSNVKDIQCDPTQTIHMLIVTEFINHRHQHTFFPEHPRNRETFVERKFMISQFSPSINYCYRFICNFLYIFESKSVNRSEIYFDAKHTFTQTHILESISFEIDFIFDGNRRIPIKQESSIPSQTY